MNVNSRIAKLEQNMLVGDGCCRCGTPPLSLDEVDGDLVIIRECPDCGRPLRRQTFAEMALEADREIEQA